MDTAGPRLPASLTGVWLPRLLWLAAGASGAVSIGNAIEARSSAVRGVVTAGGWLVWGIGVVALVVPSVLGLTAMRMTAAVALGAATVSWVGGGGAVAGGAFVACALLGALFIGSSEFGHQCVQASAYGDEQRFLLRPPVAFIVPVALAGAVWMAAVVAAPLLLATGMWIAGGVTAIAAATLTWLLAPRFHVLSRRWLVFVPAGVVVHDQVVLGETLMVARANVAGVDLALADTEAADLTGPASGHAVEVSVKTMETALLASTRANPKGAALHVQSFIVAPSRPGAVMRSVVTGWLAGIS
jgi:hypothetical protein